MIVESGRVALIERVREGCTYWIALDDLAGKDIRPLELAKLVFEHG